MATDLKLQSISDRELLHVLHDLGGDGWVDPKEVGLRLGLTRGDLTDKEYELHLRRCASTRLSWMSRLSGVVERQTVKGSTSWRLTDVGWAILRAKLNASTAQSLNSLTEAQLVSSVEAISDRYVNANLPFANLMRRQWQNATYRRR